MHRPVTLLNTEAAGDTSEVVCTLGKPQSTLLDDITVICTELEPLPPVPVQVNV
jgi:hypothetical protein